MSELTIRIQFDRETWSPTAIFCDNGDTDLETAKMRQIADVMLKALPDREVAPFEEMKK